jgi:uncharacterized protein YdhG (YjbR/CyaY superfamily)
MPTPRISTTDEYIAGFPEDVQKKLEQLRATIKKSAPDAIETFSYGMPAYKYLGYLVYFAAFKNHIGFYAIPPAVEEFKAALSVYKTGKGSVQFPLDQPLPLALIAKMVKYRVKKNEEIADIKKMKKK